MVMEQNGPSKKQHAEPKSAAATAATGTSKSPRKRRKVNHACVYCRRSHMTCDLERPCARCIKRDIGHLCHDEPRDPDASKKAKSHSRTSASVEKEETPTEQATPAAEKRLRNSSLDQSPNPAVDAGLDMAGPSLANDRTPMQIVQPTPVSGAQSNALDSSSNRFLGYSNDWLGSHNQFQDMHHYHSSYMFNNPEVTNEYNLIGDFLNNSLLDEGALLEDNNSFFDQAAAMIPGGLGNSITLSNAVAPQQRGQLPTGDPQGHTISRPASTLPPDKAREYYLQAADPSGNEPPEKRMQQLLKAKYDAGMLKPFNYVKGYARLSAYMDSHLSPQSKQKILRQLDRFRPAFREKVQTLTDIKLIYVEMWFERSLMEYDRVFASMAIPACCWRRTGEIFRGNKEMAELIHVPIEKLRDGKIALHELLDEKSLVNYWEKFGAIAFDQTKKAFLTSCYLKNPDDTAKDPVIKCCASITIRRDEHKIPSLIVGNFLPQSPVRH